MPFMLGSEPDPNYHFQKLPSYPSADQSALSISSTLYKKMLMSMSRKSRLWRFLPELAQEVK